MAFTIALEILAIFIVYLSNLNYLDNLKASSIDKINYIRIDQEEQIRQWLLKEQNTSSQISNSSDVKRGIEALNKSKGNEIEVVRVSNNLKSIFGRIIKSNQEIDSMLLFEATGKVIAYADGEAVQKPNSSYEKIQTMIRDSNLYITSKNDDSISSFFYLTIKDNQPVIAFVNPTFDGLGNRFNVLINVKTDQINQLVINNNLKTDTDSYLIGSLNGNPALIFGELQGVVSRESIPTNLVIENALLRQRGAGFYKNYADVNVVGSYSWFAPLNIAIISEVNQDKALSVSNRIFRNMILISTGLVILITFIFYFIVRQRIQTITRISDIALSVSQDNFDARFPTGYNDEIGALGIALNHMLSRFRRFRQQVLDPKDISLNSEIDQYGELLHSFIEITSEGFTFLDTNNLILRINSNFAEIISTSIADSLGVTYEEVFPEKLSEAVRNMQVNSQETYQVKFSIPYQGNYVAFLSNVFRKITNDLDQIHLLGKVIVVYAEHKTDNLIESNKYALVETSLNKDRQELSQKLSMPMISLLGFLKLTKKKLEDTIFPKLASTDIKTLKNIQQIESNLESMIAEGTQLAKSIKEAFCEDEGANKGLQINKRSRFYVDEVLKNIAINAEKLFASKSSKLILENDAPLAVIETDREQFEYIINLLLARLAQNREFRTALVQTKVIDGRATIVIGKVNSLLTRSQVSSVLSNLTYLCQLKGGNSKLTKGMGLLNIQKMLSEYGGNITVEWVDSNRESYKFYVLTFLARS